MVATESFVLVTGASSGIGAAAVSALADAGFVPIATDLRPMLDGDVPARTVCWQQPLDVSDETQVATAVQQIDFPVRCLRCGDDLRVMETGVLREQADPCRAVRFARSASRRPSLLWMIRLIF